MITTSTHKPRLGRSSGITNEDVADAFERISDLLSVQNGNPFRLRAYATAASTIRSLDLPLWTILKEGGPEALEALPGIGERLAASIEEYLRTGRLASLDRLEGEICPEALFMTVPGIGDTMAERIHDELGIETLEELEVAAHDGRLQAVPGFGARRVRAVRELLASMLGRASRRRASAAVARTGVGRTGQTPSPIALAGDLKVAELLAIDREYRELAEQGVLVTIAPRRFNPAKERWLPLLHTTVDDWEVTALFSNTSMAHRLNRTHDWVVIYAENDDVERRFTVVTERRGELKGLRVVRGREDECSAYYQELSVSPEQAPSPIEEPFFPGMEDSG